MQVPLLEHDSLAVKRMSLADEHGILLVVAF
jgi:hypothetical protein